MLRFGTTNLARAASNTAQTSSKGLVLSRAYSIRILSQSSSQNGHNGSNNVLVLKHTRRQAVRALSSNNNNKSKEESKEGEDRKELVLTPGEKVVVGTRLMMWLGLGALASVCGYYIVKELVPTKMSPNSVFDNAFDRIKDNTEVNRTLGGSLKAYGRDHGGHREGRRNFIEHTEYKCEEDGSNRTRVRFNLEGKYGTAFVFAEVSSDMKSGEFVYILVQDKRNGHVVSVVDNRSAMTAARLSGGDKEGMSAISNLLSGGK